MKYYVGTGKDIIFSRDDTVFILGNGPGLAAISPERVNKSISINGNYLKFKSSQAHVSMDPQWWDENGSAFRSARPETPAYGCGDACWRTAPKKFNIRILKQTHNPIVTPDAGLELTPWQVRGNNSGMIAINVAYHLGARRLILLGFDMTFEPYREATKTQATLARQAGMYITLGSPSQLTCYPTEELWTRFT